MLSQFSGVSGTRRERFAPEVEVKQGGKQNDQAVHEGYQRRVLGRHANQK
jgi:hypothetical protein